MRGEGLLNTGLDRNARLARRRSSSRSSAASTSSLGKSPATCIVLLVVLGGTAEPSDATTFDSINLPSVAHRALDGDDMTDFV